MSTVQYIDSHQHFWHVIRGDYGWLTPELGVLYRDYLPQDLQPLLEKNQVAHTVLVQAAPTVAETQYLLSLAEQHEFIAGVVGWVDMLASEAIATLEELSNSAYFKGIRPMLQDIEDPEWMLKPELTPVFDYLCQHQLTFDALVKPQHLTPLHTLLKRHPRLKVVIDHMGKPNIAEHKYDSWAGKIARFNELENVFVKVSGLPTEASCSQTKPADFRRYFEHVYHVFGANRMMWGSDWPVVNLNSDFSLWLNLIAELSNQWSEKEIEDLFTNTARDFYRLN